MKPQPPFDVRYFGKGLGWAVGKEKNARKGWLTQKRGCHEMDQLVQDRHAPLVSTQ